MRFMVTKDSKPFFLKSIFKWGFLPAILALNFFERPHSIAEAEALSAQSTLFCVFHKVTGWLCPGCGMTRSLLCFFSGQFELSFYFNPFGPILGILLISLWLMTFKKGEPVRIWSAHSRVNSWTLIFVMAWGILRNLI